MQTGGGAGAPDELEVGGIRVSITTDPIETVLDRERLEAAVSSDDSTLSHGGGVSAAIFRKAGPGIEAEVRARLPLEMGDVAVTSAGHLSLRYILHAVAVDWEHKILPTRRTFQELVRKLLIRAEALRIRRLAIPALGGGAAGLGPEPSLRMMLEVLERHAASPTVLERVVFSVPGLGVAALGRVVEGRRRIPPLPDEEAVHRSSAFTTTAPRAARGLSWPFGRRAEPEPSSSTTHEAPRVEPPKPLDTKRHDAARPVLGHRYVLLEELGRGGFAVVHLAWDLILRRVVAVKRLRPELSLSASLHKEAAILLDLQHEGILRVHHFEPASGSAEAYLVMEYVDWPSGDAWLAEAGNRRLPVAPVLEIGAKLCEALAYAHGRGVLHLDVKPSNVFIDPAGEKTKLGDFGLARMVRGREPRALQLASSGTRAYLAPEQKVAGGKVGVTTDVYRLAATLWDFLTGDPPGLERSKIDAGDAERRRALDALAPALAEDPSARPQGALALASAMR